MWWLSDNHKNCSKRCSLRIRTYPGKYIQASKSPSHQFIPYQNLHIFLFRPLQPNELIIFAGGLLLNQVASTTQSRRVSKITPHPSYNPVEFHDDLAILIVQQSFSRNAAIEPIALTQPQTAIPMNTICVTTGWGSLYYVRE